MRRMVIPWPEKYRPTSVGDFIDNGKALRQLEKWLVSWKKGIPRKKAAFLDGPPGVGKTSVVRILAVKHDLDLIELNASNWRTKSAIERILRTASMQRPLFHSGGRLFVLDELEGMSGSQDRGGMSALLSLIKKSCFPIILIANDFWNPRFSGIKNSCIRIKFQRIPARSVIARLRYICDREGIVAEEAALRSIAERAHGDLRSAVNDLQALSMSNEALTSGNVNWLGHRDRHEAIFNVLERLFSATTFWEARRTVDLADIDYEMLFEWIYENVPYQLTNIRDLHDALNALSRADIYFKRVRTFQAWKLLKYAFDQMTGGVASAHRTRNRSWVRFKFPQRIKMMAKTRMERRLKYEIGLKLKKPLHMGSYAIIAEVLPYLRIIFKNDVDAMNTIVKDFELEKNMVEYLTKNIQ